MVNDPLALATPPDAPSEDEYQAFVAALSESARGRAFLAEHARRSRNEDSATLLSSVQRLEGLVRAQVDAPPAENPIDDVRGMLEAIRAAQADIDLGTLTAQVAKLADLIEGVQQRIDTLATPPAPPQEQRTEQAAPVEAAAAAEETALLAPADEPKIFETETVEDVAPLSDTEAAPVEAEVKAEAEIDAEAEVEAEPEADPILEPAFDLAQPTFDVAPEPSVASEPEAAEASVSETPVPDMGVVEAETMSEPESLLAPLEFMPADDEALPETAAPAAFDEDAAMPEVAWGNEDVAVAEASATEEMPSALPSPPPGLAISALVETLATAEVETATDAPVPEATVIKAGSIPPPLPYMGEDFSTDDRETPAPGRRGRAVPPPVDPLADIKALSEEERLALFT